jgi:hypothetical protein
MASSSFVTVESSPTESEFLIAMRRFAASTAVAASCSTSAVVGS